MKHEGILSIMGRDDLPCPSFVLDEGLLEKNLKILDEVQKASGGKIILALKGFAMWSSFPQVSKYLVGTTASSMNEALLGREEFGGEVHAYCVAYSDREIEEMRKFCCHISLNSLSQWERFRHLVGDSETVASFGLRINPEYSEVETEIYNPCGRGSRFGVRSKDLDDYVAEGGSLDGLEGLHFHSLCEQGSDVLARTLEHVEANFGKYLHEVSWLNCGGGHHITRDDYDRGLLVELVRGLREKYSLDVYLEPGEAVALNTGYLVASVVDLFVAEGVEHAILDVSATAHMPDVLEMPYRPEILGGGEGGEKAYTYRLGGGTCLAGDVIGDWSFDRELKVGDRLVFTDMAHYSMVKTHFFNGVQHPAIVRYRRDSGEIVVEREFGYEDYRDRLG